MITPRPHDLLRLSAADRFTDAPSWVGPALRAAPWCVVRRSESPSGLVPIGIRGSTRDQRHAIEVHWNDVSEVVSPEELTHRVSPRRGVPALDTLDIIRPMLEETGLAWGPTGSVGFELATAVCTVGPDSDLDLLIRAPRGVTTAWPGLAAVQQQFQELAVRVDCQIELPCGAVALAELTGVHPDVMVRTVQGPRLMSRAVALS